MIYTLTLNPALDRELTVPALALDEVLRAVRVRVDCGGKGFNVSRALAALGERSVAVGLVGGEIGRRLEDKLHASGVETDFLEVAGETRTNVTVVGAGDARQIKVNEPGPTVSPAEREAVSEKVRALARRGDWWVLSGSLPPGLAPTIYGRLIQVVQSVGARVVLDSSGAPLRHGCEARPFLVKPNMAEASILTGAAVASVSEACAASLRIRSLGAENVVISLGSAGALLSEGERAWLAEPPVIRERNPNGAGDALVAGMLWSLARNPSLPEALRVGVASGAAAASLDGTEVAPRSMVEALTREVRLRQLERNSGGPRRLEDTGGSGPGPARSDHQS
jgi:1-phosphofructokinase family hexose kinase